MKLNLLDRSNYLKGLLVLIGKDKKISEDENNFIMNVGKILGFDKEFCQEAIDTLLENEYISQDPPVFSNSEFAMSFIVDGISVSLTDNDLDSLEVSYLQTLAEQNKVDKSWFSQQLSTAERISKNSRFDIPQLAVEKHL